MKSPLRAASSSSAKKASIPLTFSVMSVRARYLVEGMELRMSDFG